MYTTSSQEASKAVGGYPNINDGGSSSATASYPNTGSNSVTVDSNGIARYPSLGGDVKPSYSNPSSGGTS